MDKDPYDISLSKARAFFERAEEVAATENFDYAIELYLDGLRLSPDALEDGHAPLRQLSLIRQGRGGKKPSLIESKVRLLKGKTPLEKMLNSEYLMAKDPDHLIYAEHLMTAAVEGGYLRTGEWIAHIIFEAAKLSNKADKARFDSFILLKESVACQCALQIRPKDGELADELKNLSANMAMKKGKYGTAKTFRESIKDRDAQDKIKSADVKVEAVETARKKVQNAPDSITNILELAGALFALTTTQADEEGVKLLDNSYAKTKNFTFLKRLGEFRISRIKQQIRNLNKELKMNPQDEALTKQFGQLQHRLDEVELDHFRKCEANYPTDLRFKYEYGRTLIKAQQFDQAIPMFQASRNDPRLKTASLDKMGLCFLLKGWHDDAVDIFHQALENCVDEALDLYRKLAQADFSYKDVGQRIDFLRKNGK
jgi:tetratricopeptide (TPR) repeat protein